MAQDEEIVQSIETKEIRGVTYKVAAMILSTFFAGMVAVFGAYTGVVRRIETVNTANAVQDARINNLERTVYKEPANAVAKNLQP